MSKEIKVIEYYVSAFAFSPYWNRRKYSDSCAINILYGNYRDLFLLGRKKNSIAQS